MVTDTITGHAVDTLGVHPALVAQAGASGIDVAKLLQLLLAYGPAVLQLLAKIFGWTLPPNPLPVPPPLPTPPVVLGSKP